MDLSLKQRLLGAAVLIALAVIFVPMFMSGSAPRKSAEVETSSLAIPPAPDREFQDRVLPMTPPATTGPVTEAPPAAANADRLATVDTATAPPAGTATPAIATNVEPASTESAAAAAAQPAATAKPLPGQAANGRFFVHLGAYANARNAQDLVAALKKGRFPAFAEASTYRGQQAQRVRVGPFDNRAAAEAARLRIKKLRPSVPGSVVELAEDATADAPASALPKTRAGGWAVQLGALKDVADANKLRDRVKGAGYAAFVDKVESNGTTLWRVRAGPEADRAAAEKVRAGIKDKLKLDGIIVTQP